MCLFIVCTWCRCRMLWATHVYIYDQRERCRNPECGGAVWCGAAGGLWMPGARKSWFQEVLPEIGWKCHQSPKSWKIWEKSNVEFGVPSSGKGAWGGSARGGPRWSLGAPRRFLGGWGLLPRSSSELLGGSSEVPRRGPQARAGRPPAGRRGRANPPKSRKPTGKHRFSRKVMKNMVLTVFFTNVWHTLAEPSKTDRRAQISFGGVLVDFGDLLVVCWWCLVQFWWCWGDVAVIYKHMAIHLILFLFVAPTTHFLKNVAQRNARKRWNIHELQTIKCIFIFQVVLFIKLPANR